MNIKIETSEGEYSSMSRFFALKCPTLKRIIESAEDDGDVEEIIPLLLISSKTFQAVKAYLENEHRSGKTLRRITRVRLHFT